MHAVGTWALLTPKREPWAQYATVCRMAAVLRSGAMHYTRRNVSPLSSIQYRRVKNSKNELLTMVCIRVLICLWMSSVGVRVDVCVS